MRDLLAMLVIAVALLAGDVARAATFTPSENASLARGGTVVHRQVVREHGGRYVGGLTYTILATSPDELDALFNDVSTYPRILPYTEDARLVGRDGGDLLVWLRQGTGPFHASYTVRVSRPEHANGDPEGPRVVRFSIDRALPHGIDDASGFFRYEALPPGSPGSPGAPAANGGPRVLLTYGIWVNLGPGIVRTFFEGRIQRIVLTVPERLRAFVAERYRRPAPA